VFHFFGLLLACDCSSYDSVLEPSLNTLVHSTIRYFSAFIVEFCDQSIYSTHMTRNTHTTVKIR